MPLLAGVLADLAACLRFFSRMPIPRLGPKDDPAVPPAFARAAWLVPIAGALLVLPAALLGGLLASIGHLPPLMTGALVVAVQVAVTGALHEDGLADVADGLFGGATPEKRLAIMKDSRIGVFGGTALALSLFIRAAAVGALADIGAAAVLFGLPATAAVSRTMMVAVWHRLPFARPDGLARAVGQPSEAAVGRAALTTLVITLAALPVFTAGGIAAGLLLALAGAAAMARLARAKIGGQTGDVLGAVEQIGTLGFLVGLLI